jgi:hypothetical protein
MASTFAAPACEQQGRPTRVQQSVSHQPADPRPTPTQRLGWPQGYPAATASQLLQIWKATVYLTPLLGAFLADAYMGRFWVILVFSVICECTATLHGLPFGSSRLLRSSSLLARPRIGKGEARSAKAHRAPPPPSRARQQT